MLLFNGLGERTPSWTRVRRGLPATTRVCVFDRAGEGWSSGEAGQDGRRLAADLHELLRVAHVPGPHALAGHSVGGLYALVYAERYPDQVAGVALIDSATPNQFDLPDYPRFYSMWRRVSALLPSLARSGLARPFALSPREVRADRAEFAELPTILEQARALQSIGGKPLAVVTGTVGEQRGWAVAQRQLTRLSSNSTQRTVPGATHAALLDDERFAAVTRRAIEEVVQDAR